jgi:hypothetical protein
MVVLTVILALMITNANLVIVYVNLLVEKSAKVLVQLLHPTLNVPLWMLFWLLMLTAGLPRTRNGDPWEEFPNTPLIPQESMQARMVAQMVVMRIVSEASFSMEISGL